MREGSRITSHGGAGYEDQGLGGSNRGGPADVAGLAAPAAAQGVGAIGGTVSDARGPRCPASPVSLSNPGVIGGDQQTVTDERGAYQFTRLVPGHLLRQGGAAGIPERGAGDGSSSTPTRRRAST